MHEKIENDSPQETKMPVLTDWDRKFMAYHEAGHAVCSYYAPEREPLISISIDPSHEAFGMIRTESRQHHNGTEISLKSTIATFLAGRIAEEIFLNTKTTSCIHDLKSARQIATDMVSKFGMGSSLGLTALDLNDCPVISEEHCILICNDIQKILSDAEIQARNILLQKREIVIQLAEFLLEHYTIKENAITDFFTRFDHE